MALSYQSRRTFLDQFPFNCLDLIEQETLINASQTIEIKKRELLFLEGEACRGVYFLNHGGIKAYKSDSTGRQQTIQFFRSEALFNQIGFASGQRNLVGTMALELSTVTLIPTDAIQIVIQRSPDFANALIEDLVDKVAHLVKLAADLALRPVQSRLAEFLLSEAVDGFVERPAWFTQAELADRLGTVPDVLQRHMRQFESKGFISVSRQSIHIKKPDELKLLV